MKAGKDIPRFSVIWAFHKSMYWSAVGEWNIKEIAEKPRSVATVSRV